VDLGNGGRDRFKALFAFRDRERMISLLLILDIMSATCVFLVMNYLIICWSCFLSS
jgi:hypothetical protein